MKRKPFNPYLIQPLGAEAKQAAPRGPLTVSQVTTLVKQAIETALPATIHVVGEISNFKRHSSGHLYFTLKDASSELSCVMWRSAAGKLKFAPNDGLEVIGTGTIEVFERAGRYQLYVRKLEPRGVGALELAFRQMCEKLSEEGLFDADRKRPIPRYPRRIVLVTSPTGAAVADMIRTITRRFPCVQVFIYPVRVQGAGAAEEVARAIRRVNAQSDKLGGVDVMIVGRGGGSIEDLWAFNEEVVARAISASRIPIISAVGHEVDITVADLVADVRAATPTAAAELAVPVLDEVLDELSSQHARLTQGVKGRLALARSRLEGLAGRRAFNEPMLMVRHRAQTVDELVNRLVSALLRRVRDRRHRLEHLEPSVQRIAPQAYLLRASMRLVRTQQRIDRAVAHRLAGSTGVLNGLTERMRRGSPERRLVRLTGRFESVEEALPRSIAHRLSLATEQLNTQDRRLAAVGYESVLARGYSVTRLKNGRTLVRSLEQVSDGARLVTRVADGEFESDVVNRNQLELFD